MYLLRCPLLCLDSVDSSVLPVGNVIEGRDIDSADPGGSSQKALFAPFLLLCTVQQGEKFVVHLLPLADDEEIHERSHRLGIDPGGTSHKDQGKKPLPVTGAHGETGHIQHVQNRGIGHLIADGKGKNIKSVQPVPALKSIEWNPLLFHQIVHIAPRGKNPLAPDIGQAVHGLIKDLHAQIGHSDLVRIRKAEGHSQVYGGFVFQYLIVFSSGITRRLLHFREDSFQSFIHTNPLIKYPGS